MFCRTIFHYKHEFEIGDSVGLRNVVQLLGEVVRKCKTKPSLFVELRAVRTFFKCFQSY